MPDSPNLSAVTGETEQAIATCLLTHATTSVTESEAKVAARVDAISASGTQFLAPTGANAVKSKRRDAEEEHEDEHTSSDLDDMNDDNEHEPLEKRAKFSSSSSSTSASAAATASASASASAFFHSFFSEAFSTGEVHLTETLFADVAEQVRSLKTIITLDHIVRTSGSVSHSDLIPTISNRRPLAKIWQKR